MKRCVSHWLVSLGMAVSCASTNLLAGQQTFTLGGATVSLTEVTPDVGIYYTSMRFNRALRLWNVEVSLSNRTDQVMNGPVVLLVDSFAGTTGPLQPDGLVENAKAYYDLSDTVITGKLVPGQRSGTHTLSLGFTNGSPSLVGRVFVRPAVPPFALALARTLDDAGQPLPNVQVLESGPAGSRTNYSDPVFGLITLGQGVGVHTWQFTAPGYLPVWRQQTLTSNQVTVIPDPRLVSRATSSFLVTPIGGGQATNSSGTIQINFGPGAVTQDMAATLTALNGQTLPGFLPVGWSPLQSFCLELASTPTQPGTGVLIMDGPVGSGETAALVRWNVATLRWDVAQVQSGHGSASLSVSLPGGGTYSVVVGDLGPTAPPAPQVGQPLAPGNANSIDPAGLNASGAVVPTSSPASPVAELVTAKATVVVSNAVGVLPSGLLLRGEVYEQYRLRDSQAGLPPAAPGLIRHPPQYESFMVGYQRPGDSNAATVQASFPLRPLLLFGGEELDQATVSMDVITPVPFGGSVLDTNGGLVASGGVRVLAGQTDFSSPQAAQLRQLDPTNFTDFVANGFNVVAAFELSVSGVNPGRHLVAQAAAVPTNGQFVLARVLYNAGLYGLQPMERLTSDTQGRLSSLEPLSGERLSGLNGAGQYLVMQLTGPEALVSGIARNSGGQATGGLPVQIVGQPWLAFSASNGAFQLLAPTGAVAVTVTDLNSGDTGHANMVVSNVQTTVVVDVAALPVAPYVVSVSPTNGATRVQRVSPIQLNFSEPINPATLLGGGVQLLGSNGVPVAAGLNLNLRNTTATLLPTDPLAPSTLHTLVLSTNIASLNGLHLQGSNLFTFRTENDELNRAAAQLTIYQPGATNIPASVMSQLVGYDPAHDGSQVVAVGSPGTADGGSPVILVNETTGETATTLSKTDGSFAGFVHASEEDLVTAQLVNANGTITRVPPTEQRFDDGSVGLYTGGGTIKVPGEGGDFAINLLPGTVKSRNVFKLTPMTLAEVTNTLGNLPNDAQVIAGFRVGLRGELPEGGSDVSIPIDPARIHLPNGEPPENGAYALAMVRQLETGETVYEIVDKLTYENGRLNSHSPPYQSIADSLTEAIANNPIGVLGLLLNPTAAITEAAFTILVLGTRPITVTGRVGVCQASTQGGCVDQELDPFLQGLDTITGLNPLGLLLQPGQLAGDLNQGVRKPLSGAFLSLSLPGQATANQGRLQPGMAFATSNRKGVYALVLPFANSGYVLTATHPRFAERLADPLRPLVDYQLGQGAISRHFGFQTLLAADSAPLVDVAHTPLFAATNQTVTMTVDAIHPTIQDIIIVLDHVDSDAGGTPSDVTTVSDTLTTIDSNHKRKVRVLKASKKLTAQFRISAVGGGSSPPALVYHGVPIGLVPPATTNLPIVADPLDTQGPQIERTDPLAGGVLGLRQPIALIFNEAIDRDVINQASQFTLDDPSMGQPALALSDDQTRLEISFPVLKPDTDYKLTVSATIKDVSGNKFAPPGIGADTNNFKLKFHTQPAPVTPLPTSLDGGGVAVNGNYAYVLDRTVAGSTYGRLLVYDISIPAQPRLANSTITFIGRPRDLVILPAWPHVSHKDGPHQTNDLLAVVEGNLGTSAVTGGPGSSSQGINIYFQGMILRVFDLSDPANPVRVLGAVLTLRPTAINKIRWQPPFLAFMETGSDLQQVGLIDLQEMLVGFNATPAEIDAFPLFGIRGDDHDHDGNYMGPNDRVPTPPRQPNEFFGRERSYLPDPTNGTRPWLDFDFKVRGGYCGVVFRDGFALDNLGNPTSTRLKPGYRTLALGDDIDSPSATYEFDFGAIPKRVFALLNEDISTNSNPDSRNLALVSLAPDKDGKPKLAILDITVPASPVPLNMIEFPANANLGLPQSIERRADGTLALAFTSDLLLLDQRKFLLPAPAGGGTHPAIIGLVPGAGSGNISLGGNNAGVNAVALAGRDQLVQTAPALQFVRVLRGSMTDPAALKSNPDLRKDVFDAMIGATVIGPARFRSAQGITSSTLTPANPTNHYYVLMRAPGGAGSEITLGLQSLNRAGYPLKNKGKGFAPVRAVSDIASGQLNQQPRGDCDAPIRGLKAYRLAGPENINDPFYNLYLSKPFALTYEKMSIGDLNQLKQDLDREIIWTDFYLEAFIDPEMSSNPVLGPFIAKVTGFNSDGQDQIIQPRAAVVAESFPATYVMGPNPAPLGDIAKVPGTFGLISANNGEFRHETLDIALPGRRMPIVFERTIGGQDIYEGPFGFGWDFSYNQRLTVLRPEVIAGDHRMPQILRSLSTDSVVAEAGDVLWLNGAGRIILYKRYKDPGGAAVPPEVNNDPLVQQLGWKSKTRDYYLPASTDAGVFDPLFEFQNGEFARLTPDGRQFWYDHAGRLLKIYHRYTQNVQKLSYNERGELTKIVDGAIDGDKRFLELGYYRLQSDSLFRQGLDTNTDKVFIAGKIARLKDYTGRSIDYFYTEDGILKQKVGFEASSANSGESGRVTVTYVSPDDCSGALQGVTAGGNASQTTSPLFSASFDDEGKVSGAGNGPGGQVTVTPPGNNTAAGADGSKTTSTGPDGGTTEFTFDKGGHPSSVKYSGSGGGTSAEVKRTYNSVGLIEKVEYALGNSIVYTYDTNNASLRSRANLTQEQRFPGSRQGPTLTRTMPTYDGKYNLPTGTHHDFNGKTLTYTLANQGLDIQSIDYEAAGTQSFTYNTAGQVESETTPEGLIIGTPHDTDGFKSSETRGPAVFTFNYDQNTRAGKLGVPTKVLMPRGANIDLTYDDRLLLINLTRGGYSDKRGYDLNGNLKHRERTVSTGQTYIEDRSYNRINFLETLTVKSIEVNGSAQDLPFAFHSTAQDLWRVRTMDYPGGQTKHFDYDFLGNVTKMTLGNYKEEYGRDLHGNLTSVTYNGTLTQEYQYDGHDRLTNTIRHLRSGGSANTGIGYFDGGETAVISVKDPDFGELSHLEITQIDGLGRARHEKVGTTRTVDYSVTYPTVSGGGYQMVLQGPIDTQTTTFDGSGRVKGVKDALADITFTLNGNGGIEGIDSREDATTYTDTFTYDPLDQRQDHTAGGTTLFTFTPRMDGRPAQVIDGLGNTEDRSYTPLGELTSSSWADGVQRDYQYDLNRERTSVKDKQTKGHTFEYDISTFHQTRRTLRSGAAYVYTYTSNPLDLPETATIPGGTMEMGYDLQGQLTKRNITYNQGDSYSMDCTPDALGRIRSTTYHQGNGSQHTATFTYDGLGPMTSATYQENLGSFTVGSTIYDDASRHTLVYPPAGGNSTTLTESRDAAGRISSISSSSGGEIYKVTTYAGANERGEVTIGGGVIQEHGKFDARRRMQARRFENSAGNLLADVRYQYDAANNRTARQEIHRHGRADVYEHDNGNRLKRADLGLRPTIPGAVRHNQGQLKAVLGLEAGFFARTYTYDGSGGGLDLLHTIQIINPDTLSLPPFAQSLDGYDNMLFPGQLDGASRPAPDALGNTAGTTLWVREPGASQPVPVTATLTYDGLSHLARVSYTVGGVNVLVEYESQPGTLTHYRKVTRNGTVVSETAFVYDGGRLINEYEKVGGSVQPRAQYYYADEDTPFAADLSDGTGNLIRHYYLSDAQGSVLAVADGQGNVVERVSYDAWGQPQIQARDQAPPRVAAIFASINNELLVEFTELVMPPLSSTAAGTAFVTTTAGLGGSFDLSGTNGPIGLGQITYEEDLPGGFPFGAVLRLRPQGTVPSNLVLHVHGGAVVDEWGITNVAEDISFSLGNSNVLYQGPLQFGSTAPPRVARSSVGSPFLFHGQYFDYDTGLLYLRARWYDPYTGQFLQQDPLGYEDSVNLYAGFRHNPASIRDPTGMAGGTRPPKGRVSSRGPHVEPIASPLGPKGRRRSPDPSHGTAVESEIKPSKPPPATPKETIIVDQGVDDLTDPLSPRKTDVTPRPEPTGPVVKESGADQCVAALDAFEKNERAQQAIEAAFELDPSDPAKFRQQVEGLAEHDIFFTTSEVLEFVTEGTAEGVKRFEARNRGRSNMDSGQTFLDRALIDEALAGGEAGQQALTLIQSEILHEVVGRELIMRAPQVTGQIIGFGEQAVLNRQFNRFPAIAERLGARRGLTLKEVRGDAF